MFLLRSGIITIIQWQARCIIKRYQPKIIAVTGSVGKTSTKDAVYTLISEQAHVRRSRKSFNSGIGIPLTIIGAPTGWRDILKWLRNMIKGFWVMLRPWGAYPEWLVLEVGVGKPGDMDELKTWVRPDMVVVSAFGSLPSHVEFFEDEEAVWAEESAIIDVLKPNGVLVLNRDDERVYALKKRRTENQRVITFGFHEDADIAISNYAYISADGRPVGTRADLVWRNTAQSVEQTATLGKSFYYALAAAYAVYTDLFGAHPHLQDIVDTLVPPPGRLRVLEGVLDTVLIDDTYNSSPPALMHALDTLKELDTKGRKIAIIGDMLELGKFSDDAHRDAGIRAATFVDYLITVGPRAELCSQAALQHGLPQSIVFHAADADMALAHMLDIIEPADTILVKASQGVRLEKVSYGLLKDKERRHDLLVRQEKEWLDK